MKALDQVFARVRFHSHRLHPPTTARLQHHHHLPAPLNLHLLNRRPGRKVFQVQAAFQAATAPFFASFSSNSTATAVASTNTMASLPANQQQDINRTLSFWFDGPDAMQNWFRPADPEAFDASITDQFGTLVTQARHHELDSWADASPASALALVLLLDQFPRNMFRGSGETHDSDAKACDVAVRAIAREFDRPDHDGDGAVTDLQSLFFYLPLMHDETLSSQIAAVAFIENLANRCRQDKSDGGPAVVAYLENSLRFAKGHRDTILRFGRFPSRNAILGREGTEEEIRFLKENPSGFL